DVVKKYPDGNKVPDALYRQGVALIEIGLKNREEEVYAPAAREIFERIVKEHPSSTRVPEAEKQLEKLRL
ncbi:MAG: tetratricopeptide repeat protein, partial [Myxococcota bacterium]